jgi:O-Antigen ligase
MDNDIFYNHQPTNSWLRHLWLIPGILLAIYFGWLIAGGGVALAGLFIVLPFAVAFLMFVFFFPRAGLISYIIYCFIMPTLGKHIEGPQFGLGVDALLILTWLGVVFNRSNKYRLRHLKNDFVMLAFVWFIITLIQIGNPARPNIQGWLQEMRSSTLYWVLTVPLVVMVFNKKSDIYLFLDIIILFSALAAIWGIKQLYIGPDAAEQRWLDNGAKKTHILFGKLRVFSYFSEAAQFGASQAQLAIMCIILAIGPHTKKRKIWYGVAAALTFYGMLISGTRGAMGGLVGGGFIFLILSKNVKVLLIGGLIGASFLGILKYTKVGNDNNQIRRMRSSLDPNDASLQVRLINQRTIKELMRTKPIGWGVGTIGQWGVTYNKDKMIASIPPDSLFVKIWVMYGVVGIIIWLSTLFYITGKASGLIWKTRDPALRNCLSALCAGQFGIIVCSYGNEVLNAMPSSCIVYVSWALLSISHRFDTPAPKIIEPDKAPMDDY